MESVENKRDWEIKETLSQIQQYLNTEIVALKASINKKDNDIKEYKEQLTTAKKSIEGNRQLINKLLGDLSKLQNDVEWYKRTYEQRSFLGTVKEKLLTKKKKK